MKKFKLSEDIDPNKVFIVNRSELEGRIDSTFYVNKPDFHNTIRLSKIAKIKGGKRIPRDADYSDIDTPNLYLRVTDIDESTEFNYLNFKNISDELYEKLKRYEVFENELIISIAGTVGKTKVVKNIPDKKRVILTENCVKILTNSDILPQYLNIVLQTNFLQKQIEISYIQTTIPKLGIDKILGLKIPQIPPLEIQQQIVNLYEKAYTEKQQKEAEAQKLLDSIDDYLLGELGITLPKEEEHLLQNTDKNSSYNLDNDNPLVKKGRLFLTNLSEVTGKRIDSKGYDIKTKLLKNSIDNIDSKKFIILPLKSFIIQSIAGNWGIDENEEIEENEKYQKCLVIRATEFDNQYNLNLDNSRVKYRLIKKNILSKIDLKENDLLIEKSGGSPDQPVGRIAIITQNIIKNNILCYSNFIHKIRVDNKKINPKYLFCFLKMMHNIRLTEAMQSQTNGIRNLIMSTYLNQNIVIPISENGIIDIQKQTEIANRITAIREEAKKLQLEAINILETAKRDIEQMILGD